MAKVGGPCGGGGGVGGEALSGELDDLAGFDVDFVDVSAAGSDVELAAVGEIVEDGVVDPLAVEGDEGIGDGRFFVGLDEDFFGAIGMEEHEVSAGLHKDGAGDLGVVLFLDRVAAAFGADVGDVVVVVDGFVGGDEGDVNVDGVAIQLLRFFFGGERKGECEEETEDYGLDALTHRLASVGFC